MSCSAVPAVPRQRWTFGIKGSDRQLTRPRSTLVRVDTHRTFEAGAGRSHVDPAQGAFRKSDASSATWTATAAEQCSVTVASIPHHRSQDISCARHAEGLI